MSSLTFEKLKIKGADLNGESSLPPIAGMTNTQQILKADLDEDDGLFIGYGFVDSSFPYRLKDEYTRELHDIEFDCAVLENEYLKAVFLPSLGGRLWSLFDKVEKRELLFTNPVFRPGNLGVCNAWFSGGIEWNCGIVGHTPYTCSQLFTARLTGDDGAPVLRMYEFERIRRATYQMDFSLPDDSKLLLCRMRIVNPNSETIPMYWWSNIAVPELRKARVVVSANETYTNRGCAVSKTTVPVSRGVDITYPVNILSAIDYFWKLSENARKYICQLDENGYGLIQTSTNRLMGRKLFVWGQSQGSRNWQEHLSVSGTAGEYVEIQAGLAHTQYECLPMPPNTAWEWMEAYGAMQADGSRVHGDWDGAKAEVESRLSEMVLADDLERLLVDTRATTALKPADEIIMYGSGWGALENLRRAEMGAELREEHNSKHGSEHNSELGSGHDSGPGSEPDSGHGTGPGLGQGSGSGSGHDSEYGSGHGSELISRHLDFGSVGREQQQWVDLLRNKSFGDVDPREIPISWMHQTEWTKILEEAVGVAEAPVSSDKNNWYTWIQLGMIYFAERKFRDAKKALINSMRLESSCWALYGLSNIARIEGDKENAAKLALRVAYMIMDDASIIKETMKLLLDNGMYNELFRLADQLRCDIANQGIIKLYKAFAYIRSGEIHKADAILNEGGGIVVEDLREGDNSITKLWFEVEKAKAAEEDRVFDPESSKPPKKLDYRA